MDRVLEQEREEKVERALEGVEVQLEVADGAGHERTLAPGRTRLFGTAICGPAACAGARGRPRLCESQNHTTPAMQTIPETQVLTRRPRMWFAGSMRTSSIQKRPKE